MRRWIVCALVMALALSLALPCAAVEETLHLSGGKAAGGQTVYLTLELKTPVKANTVGITCQFDKQILTAVPELSSWGVQGLIAAFEKDNMGGLALSAEKTMEGKLCVLAFRVKEDAAFDQTQVECTVKFKTDDKELGSYTASAAVLCQCVHSYGDWKSAGGMGHARVCSLCGGKNTETHQWDDGTEQKKGDVTIITKTCLVCKEQLVTEMPSGGEGNLPEPGKNPPDATVGHPDHDHENEKEQGVEVIIGEDGSVINKETGDVILPAGADSTLTIGADTHDHDHDEVITIGASDEHDHDHTPGGEDPITLWVILGVLALAVAGGLLFLKKKR